MKKLTDEQQAIVQHPMGKHACVLAVVGSGKTTTMVARIKYLVEEQGIDRRVALLHSNARVASSQFILSREEEAMTLTCLCKHRSCSCEEHRLQSSG